MYCSEQAFEARFGSKERGELLPEGEGDDGRSYSAVAADADSLIDSYLAGRYVVPLSPVPRLISGIAADVTRYKLYDDAPPKEVNARYKDAIKLLEQLRDGEITVPGLVPTNIAGGVAVSASEISFTEDTQNQYMGCL